MALASPGGVFTLTSWPHRKASIVRFPWPECFLDPWAQMHWFPGDLPPACHTWALPEASSAGPVEAPNLSLHPAPTDRPHRPPHPYSRTRPLSLAPAPPPQPGLRSPHTAVLSSYLPCSLQPISPLFGGRASDLLAPGSCRPLVSGASGTGPTRLTRLSSAQGLDHQSPSCPL